jgi:hypothetical protein
MTPQAAWSAQPDYAAAAVISEPECPRETRPRRHIRHNFVDAGSVPMLPSNRGHVVEGQALCPLSYGVGSQVVYCRGAVWAT